MNPMPSFKSSSHTRTRVKVVDIGANPIDSAPPCAALLKAGDADVAGFDIQTEIEFLPMYAGQPPGSLGRYDFRARLLAARPHRVG